MKWLIAGLIAVVLWAAVGAAIVLLLHAATPVAGGLRASGVGSWL